MKGLTKEEKKEKEKKDEKSVPEVVMDVNTPPNGTLHALRNLPTASGNNE